jgi:hypothetical protein
MLSEALVLNAEYVLPSADAADQKPAGPRLFSVKSCEDSTCPRSRDCNGNEWCWCAESGIRDFTL